MRHKRHEPIPPEDLNEPFGPPPEEYLYRCSVCQTQAGHLGVVHLCLWSTTGRRAGLDMALVKIVHNDVQYAALPRLQRYMTARRARAPRAHQQGNAMNAVQGATLFDAQLMRETLRSERLRATMLASVGVVIGLTLFLLSRLDASEFLTALRQTKTEYTMLGLIGGLVLYELGLRHMLGKFLQSNRRAPLPLRYVNAWLETTIPTMAIILFAQRFEPMYALISVAPSPISCSSCWPRSVSSSGSASLLGASLLPNMWHCLSS